MASYNIFVIFLTIVAVFIFFKILTRPESIESERNIRVARPDPKKVHKTIHHQKQKEPTIVGGTDKFIIVDGTKIFAHFGESNNLVFKNSEEEIKFEDVVMKMQRKQ
ncbi:unnamed protein product [Owenia fusiformis]|uniref:Uncharacterized protein n=1 Tax=Owenia fusiformis TaxID=6347 RepID=A0A8S4PTI1_OWEFU|nr:unnamed protein product [Owenia fusiformis]